MKCTLKNTHHIQTIDISISTHSTKSEQPSSCLPVHPLVCLYQSAVEKALPSLPSLSFTSVFFLPSSCLFSFFYQHWLPCSCSDSLPSPPTHSVSEDAVLFYSGFPCSLAYFSSVFLCHFKANPLFLSRVHDRQIWCSMLVHDMHTSGCDCICFCISVQVSEGYGGTDWPCTS